MGADKPNVDAALPVTKRYRWLVLWIKWTVWIGVFGTLYFGVVSATGPKPLGFPGFAVGVTYGGPPYFIVGLLISGVLTLAAWLVFRAKTNQMLGESTSFVRGALIAGAVGVAVAVVLQTTSGK